MEKRMEVLSRPVGPTGRRPITRKRVVLYGLSSMRLRSMGTSYVRAASSDATAATLGSSFARSAAAVVDDISSRRASGRWARDRKSTRLNSSHVRIAYAVFYLKQKT